MLLLAARFVRGRLWAAWAALICRHIAWQHRARTHAYACQHWPRRMHTRMHKRACKPARWFFGQSGLDAFRMCCALGNPMHPHRLPCPPAAQALARHCWPRPSRPTWTPTSSRSCRQPSSTSTSASRRAWCGRCSGEVRGRLLACRCSRYLVSRCFGVLVCGWGGDSTSVRAAREMCAGEAAGTLVAFVFLLGLEVPGGPGKERRVLAVPRRSMAPCPGRGRLLLPRAARLAPSQPAGS